MKKWSVSTVKIHLGKILKEDIQKEPQVITYRNEPAAVIINYKDYLKLINK